MMAHVFALPDPGEGIHEAEILDVCVTQGDTVQEGDIVLQIETDKAIVDVPSPYTGTVAEIKVNKGDVVRVGAVLMTFTTGEAEPETAPQRIPPPAAGNGAKRTAQEAAAQPATSRARGVPGPVPASPATRRLALELGVDLQAVSGSGPEGRVTAEDVRAFADKTPQVTPPAPAQEIAERTHEEAAAAAPAAPAPVPEQARPLLIELPPLPDFSRWGPVKEEPLQGVRRATARQMSLAWSQIPHVVHQDVADITALETFRREHAAEVAQYGGKLTLTVLVMQAAVAALKQFPRFNASLDPQGGRLILKQYYHIGVAVDTERGLLVPVVRDVDRKSLTELAVELQALAERTRAGKVSRDELQGGTFTITNPGSIGGTGFAPIINYPEVAILGLARARLEPVVQGDVTNFTIAPRWQLPLSLAFDHRVNDGADAARFVRTMIDILHDPESFLLRV